MKKEKSRRSRKKEFDYEVGEEQKENMEKRA